MTKSHHRHQERGPVSIDDFYAHMPRGGTYIFTPNRDIWPASSVDARCQPVEISETVTIKASAWLAQNRAVEQMTWLPGESEIITDRLIAEGGWINRPGARVFNLYREPTLELGDPDKADLWIELLSKVYPEECCHILSWLAHRVQRPDEKVNHALVMGGRQGIGKDTILEPVKHAVGPWNFSEISPSNLVGRFNGFVKSVILRVSEASDLGDMSRVAFYEHSKTYIASPPDVLRVDEKHRQECPVPNLCGVVITTNYKSDGIYIPADDRRHFVAWSPVSREEFTDDYWTRLWGWYEKGGIENVAAFLACYDLSDFNPKDPPPKTQAFLDIVDANRAPEDSELADALDYLNNPEAVTLGDVVSASRTESFEIWLSDRRNSRKIPQRMELAGYVKARSPTAEDGRWKVMGQRVVIYARQELSLREQLAAAEIITRRKRSLVASMPGQLPST